jgi:O-antigen ligase
MMDSEAQPRGADTRAARISFADLAAGACLVLPWLWPFAPGPSASVVPWLAGASCAVLLALFTGARVSRTLIAALIVLTPVSAWRAASPLEPAALGGGLLVVALMAGVGASLLERGHVALIARCWWIAAAISTAFALLQYFAAAGTFAPWISTTEAGTAYANLRQRNQFASLTSIGVAALLWEARRGTRVELLVPLAAWLGLGNAASVSRTGLLEFVALAALVALWPGRSRRQAQVAASALTAYGIGVLVLPLALSAVTGISGENLWQRVSNPDSCASRGVLWSNVLHLIRERPWLGWGWGELDWGHYVTLYPGARFCDILDNAHNLPLHLAVELGLPIALGAVGLVAWAALCARPWNEADTQRQLAWAVLTVVAIHSMLEYPLWYVPFQLACGLAVGILWPRDVMGSSRPAVRRFAPGLLAIAIIYAVWDYTRVSQIYLPAEERLAAYRDDPLARGRGSWLFREHAQFAELTLTPLTRANAQWTYDLASEMLHYSPEPRVIEKVIESALQLGRQGMVQQQLARFRAAFPKEHAQWLGEHAGGRSAARLATEADDAKD